MAKILIWHFKQIFLLFSSNSNTNTNIRKFKQQLLKTALEIPHNYSKNSKISACEELFANVKKTKNSQLGQSFAEEIPHAKMDSSITRNSHRSIKHSFEEVISELSHSLKEGEDENNVIFQKRNYNVLKSLKEEDE